MEGPRLGIESARIQIWANSLERENPSPWQSQRLAVDPLGCHWRTDSVEQLVTVAITRRILSQGMFGVVELPDFIAGTRRSHIGRTERSARLGGGWQYGHFASNRPPAEFKLAGGSEGSISRGVKSNLPQARQEASFKVVGRGASWSSGLLRLTLSASLLTCTHCQTVSSSGMGITYRSNQRP